MSRIASLRSRFTLPPEVGLRHVQDFISVAVDHGLDHVQVEPRCLREAYGGRKGDFLTSNCYVDECRTRMRKCLGERRLHLLRSIDSPATNPSGVGDVGEILVVECGAVILDASGLHLLLHETKCSVVEDHNFDIELKLTKGE